jgi:predicted site-specific integrase-resolvase
MQSTQGTQYLNPQVAANALMVTAQTLRRYEKEGSTPPRLKRWIKIP